ncbi:MAG: cytochrome c [Alphaproteobacteria bacterium]
MNHLLTLNCRLGAALAAVSVLWLSATASYADDIDIDAGKRLFTTHCTSCHGIGGIGGAGAKLDDDDSLHGERMIDIVFTIMNGVKNKPMKPWRGRLTMAEIEQVAAYVRSLHGTSTAAKATNDYGYMF